MNKLLQHQINTCLNDFEDISLLQPFLEAIHSSYTNYEEQLKLPTNTSEEKIQTKLVSENKLLLKKLETQHEELNNYSNIVSHQLKSPLVNICTLTNWVKEDYANKLDNKATETLDLILSNVEKANTLINGILEYSTIDKIEIGNYSVDTHNLAEKMIGCFETPNTLKITIANKLPKINGDTHRLSLLFQNLIQNAINYSKPEGGEIVIGVKDKGLNWQFFIKDNGIGIEEVYHDKIFNAFNKLSSKVNSAGIGLSIAEKIVAYYKGEIWVKSKINKGATFYFTLPKE